MGSDRIPNRTVQREIARIFGEAPPFDPDRSAGQLLANCAQWPIPQAPDDNARQWYRAATTIHAIPYRTIEQHQTMLMLYEAAARRGHYGAVKNLTILYTESALVRKGRFRAEPRKARAWMDYGLLQRQWAGALEWVATAVRGGGALFEKDRELGMAYLQKASDLGVALAQFQLALYYGNRLHQVDKEKALLQCAAAQDFSAALYDWAGYRRIHGYSQEALELYQRAVMAGGEKGGRAAFSLGLAFANDASDRRKLGTEADPLRKRAYFELNDALVGGAKSKGNKFLTFPRLNEVLPLPPAEITEWHGIYSAMSPDDAAYYQNPVGPEVYIRDIREAGYLVPEEYVSQPVLDAQ